MFVEGIITHYNLSIKAKNVAIFKNTWMSNELCVIDLNLKKRREKYIHDNL
jgi:hypothetical protein